VASLILGERCNYRESGKLNKVKIWHRSVFFARECCCLAACTSGSDIVSDADKADSNLGAANI
jgi:hypothetical protein